MIVLNLGCGTRTSDQCVNIDWAWHLRIAANPVLKLLIRAIMSREEYQRFTDIPENIRCHNLMRGIPYPAGAVDAVYHSHVLEHIDRDMVDGFLREILRVLKPGGIHRICAPDLEYLVNRYRESLEAYDRTGEGSGHEVAIADILEQSVRREAAGSAKRSPLRRRLENLIMGDARKRGETHQWMYDRCNVVQVLTRAGFVEVVAKPCNQSDIPGWSDFGLEANEAGEEHKPESFYVECRAPTA